MTPPSSRSRAPGVLGLLAQGCMPALETLKIRSWSPEVGSYEALGQALSGGQLLMLRSLEIDVGRSHDTVNGLVPPEAIAALVSGLEAPCVQLRALAVEAGSGSVDLSQADASLFARTLSVEGGGLSRLEELKVSLKEGQAMFEALGRRALRADAEGAAPDRRQASRARRQGLFRTPATGCFPIVVYTTFLGCG